MAAPANARGGLGWVILVVALAVPGVLFYNWWSHLKAEREKAVAAKARGRLPDGGMFQSSPNAKLVNPMTPAVSTAPVMTTVAVAAPPATAPAMAAPPAALPPVVAAAPVVAPPALPPPAAVTAPVAGAPADAAPGGTGISFSSTTASVVPLKRDPTLSPFDTLRMIEEEEAKRRAADDLENMKRAKRDGGRPRKAVVKDPKNMVNLQGIISNPESGFKAIVNDEVLGAGEMIGNTKIKIIKITDLGVTFQYQGKRFSKGVSRD